MGKKNSLYDGKERKREERLKKGIARIEKGQFISEDERFRWNGFLTKKSGNLVETFIGFENVYKNLSREQKEFKFDETMKTMYGYKLLLKNGIPVTKHKGSITIQGRKNEVFEKARDVSKEEVIEKIDELLRLVQCSSRKGLYIDTHLDNFGIDRRGRIVIRDTNFIEEKPKEEAMYYNLSGLKQNLCKRGVDDKKILEKIDALIVKGQDEEWFE